MAWFIYSHEALPNPEMQGKPRYTPDGSYIRWGGVTLPPIPKQKWTALPDHFTTVRRQDWKDRQGIEVEVNVRRFKAVVDSQFAQIGVIMLDHEPDHVEKKKLEEVSADLNKKWRAKQIEFFENQREMAKARQGVYDPSPYIDECYDILAFPKPYSVDTLKSQRMPGHEAAERIADAITSAMKASRKEAADEVADLLTRPEPARPQARP